MNTRTKPILAIEFDGVIHALPDGRALNEGAITGAPVAGALDFLRSALEHFDVMIYSSRSATVEGVEAMQDWLTRHAGYRDHPRGYRGWLRAIKWPADKPFAHVTLDDRAVTFSGAWPSVRDLLDFRPWHSASNVNAGARLVNSGAFAYADLERRHLAAVQLLCAINNEAILTPKLHGRIAAVLTDTTAKHAVRIRMDGMEVILEPITPVDPPVEKTP